MIELVKEITAGVPLFEGQSTLTREHVLKLKGDLHVLLHYSVRRDIEAGIEKIRSSNHSKEDYPLPMGNRHRVAIFSLVGRICDKFSGYDHLKTALSGAILSYPKNPAAFA